MELILVFLSLLMVSTAQNLTSPKENLKKHYVCPKYFVRIARRCYFFSRNAVTWQEAFYQCRDKNSNIAIIKTANQDRRIRKILHRPIHATKERWLGGMYNWKQMKWLWAASGKPLTYQGFANQNFTENQNWHCIVMDPALDYKWNTKPCIEKKPYICHKKAEVLTKTNNFFEYAGSNDLNEILPSNGESNGIPSNLQKLSGDIQFKNAGHGIARYTRREKRRKKNRRRKKIGNTTILLHRPKYKYMNQRERRYPTNITNRTSNVNSNVPTETIKYQIYKEENKIGSSLYPKPIVEEYSYVRNNSV
ncbi:hypothetical protein WA026_003397 [Henosepilachna vigintioctopunctata]|uniref:C-type lectin domain-containing protein n=1 Tax=Henosepilachna vigintioctopunctata TaxID=420089 RepID=A0AAW1TIW9_9CUCU